MTTNQLLNLIDDYANCRGAQDCGGSREPVVQARAAVVAALEQMIKDAERFEYVASCTRCYGADINGMHSYSTQYRHKEVSGPSFEEAIDAAIAASKEQV